MKTITVDVSTLNSTTSTDLAKTSRIEAEALLQKAHRVLLHYLPGATLPAELPKVRAMLDSHMFGVNKRIHRDSVLEVARQIDRILPASVRPPQRRSK